MSDRKNTNKYYPPDYDPTKGSLNTQSGYHALRKRANRLDEGILVVRFEQPYNAWCTSCHAHIGKGVRFNADKQEVGNYFTTKIWQFSMTCPSCKSPIVIRTDPKTSQYIMYKGIRPKEESFSAGDVQTIELLDQEEKERMKTDALFALEHGEKDKSAAQEEHDRLLKLYALNERHHDPFTINAELRRRNRTVKKERASLLQAGKAKNLPFALVPISHASTEAEIPEVEEFKKRKALNDRARTLTRDKKKVKRSHERFDSQLGTSARAAAAASSFSSSSLLSIAAAASSASSLSSISLPLRPVSTFSSTPATSPALPTTPPSTSQLLGLSAYASDEEDEDDDGD